MGFSLPPIAQPEDASELNESTSDICPCKRLSLLSRISSSDVTSQVCLRFSERSFGEHLKVLRVDDGEVTLSAIVRRPQQFQFPMKDPPMRVTQRCERSVYRPVTIAKKIHNLCRRERISEDEVRLNR